MPCDLRLSDGSTRVDRGKSDGSLAIFHRLLYAKNRSFRICANLPRLETWDGTGVEQFVRRCSSAGNEECALRRGSIHKEFVVLPFEDGIKDASEGRGLMGTNPRNICLRCWSALALARTTLANVTPRCSRTGLSNQRIFSR